MGFRAGRRIGPTHASRQPQPSLTRVWLRRDHEHDEPSWSFWFDDAGSGASQKLQVPRHAWRYATVYVCDANNGENRSELGDRSVAFVVNVFTCSEPCV